VLTNYAVKDWKPLVAMYMLLQACYHYGASSGFQKPVHIATSSIQKLFGPRLSGFLNPENQ
jgi:hypothetical protein